MSDYGPVASERDGQVVVGYSYVVDEPLHRLAEADMMRLVEERCHAEIVGFCRGKNIAVPRKFSVTWECHVEGIGAYK